MLHTQDIFEIFTIILSMLHYDYEIHISYGDNIYSISIPMFFLTFFNISLTMNIKDFD